MANIFKKLFGFQDKKDTTYTGQRPKPIEEYPSYTSARDLLASYGSPTSYADAYRDIAFEPLRNQTLYNLENIVKPQTVEALQRAGLSPTSTQGVQMLEQPVRQAAVDLPVQEANLRLQGLQTGYGKETEKLGALQTLLNQERANQAERVGFDERDYASQVATANAREQANQAALGRVLGLGGSALSYLTGGNALDWLKNMLKPTTPATNVGLTTGLNTAKDRLNWKNFISQG